MSDKTIYALSTVFGKSGVAVIRVSGADALNVIKEITKINVENIKPRYAYYTPILDKNNRDLLDKALVVYFH